MSGGKQLAGTDAHVPMMERMMVARVVRTVSTMLTMLFVFLFDARLVVNVDGLLDGWMRIGWK